MSTVFIAGASGFVGRALLEELGRGRTPFVPRAQVRSPERAELLPSTTAQVVVDPRDVDRLAEAMQGCEAVVQLIGTTRQALPVVENPYEEIDYGCTVAVGQAALRVGARRILYVSSVGAGEPRGRFLHWKREAERWLEQSGLDWTVLRPSFLTGRGHRTPLLLLPLLAWSPELRPLPVADLARALTRCLAEPSVTVGRTFEGQALRALAQ